MFRDASLHCLAGAVHVGLLQTATAGATRFDPLVRGMVRSSVRAALRAAAAATKVSPEGDGEVHHLRLAFLIRAERSAGIAADDVAAVALAYEAAAVGYPRKGMTFWPASFGLIVALVLAGVTAVLLFFRPTAEDRFRKTPLAKALGQPLTEYVIAIAKQSSPAGLARLQKSRDAILAPDVKSQIGDEAARQLGDVLLHAANVANVDAETSESETKRLDQSLSVLNLRLAEHKVPACLDAYIVPRAGGAAVWVLGYYAKRQVEITLDGEKSTVFWGSRLDDLNFTSGGGAYKSGEGRSVIISLDDLEGDVLRELLPALGGDGKLALGAGSFESGATSSVPKAQKRLTELVRGEIAKAGLIGESLALEIAELVSRRDVVLAGLRFEGRGGKKLRLSPRWTEELRAMHDLTANQALKLDDRLGSPEYVRAVAKVVDVLAVLQEEEFVGYLHAYKEPLDSPAELKAVAGNSTLSRASLAARLALLARPQAYPFVELARIATVTMTPGWSSWEVRATLVAIGALARELGHERELVARNAIDRDALAESLVDVASHSPDEVRAAANRAYEKLFARPAPQLSRQAL